MSTASIEQGVRRTFSPDIMRIVEVASRLPHGEERDWAITHAGLDKLPYTGKGQRVGVLDTGCDVNHQDLKGQVTPRNFISGNKERPAWRDTDGHGTFCTGEIVAKINGKGIVGVAPEATALSGRVLYGNRKDHTRRNIDGDIARGVRACADDGCGVISMSLGGPGQTQAMHKAIAYAVDKGCIVVAAAGNERLEGSPYVSYPAGDRNVISVAAANSADLPAWFSTIGKGGHKLSQPEVAIASKEYYWGCLPGRSSYGRMIGTSMSTPLFAGIALLWREAQEAKGTLPAGSSVLVEFRKWLRRVVNDTNKNGWDPELGYGVLLLEDGEL